MITPNEALRLEALFAGREDRELVMELVRRKRLLSIDASTVFWPEMREVDGYMGSIRGGALHKIARELGEDHNRRALKQTVRTDPLDPNRHILNLSATVLVAKKQ